MKGPKPIFWFIIVGCVLLILLFLLLHFSSPFAVQEDMKPRVYLLYASAGSMPQLLNTNQIDSFIIWEPVVANAQLSGIGKMIATPADLPPPGKWENTASCILVLRNDVITQYPDTSALLSALTIAAINRTNEEPELAEEITADWVFGNNSILTPDGSLDPSDVENLSFSNMVFTACANPPESGLSTNAQEEMVSSGYNAVGMINSGVALRGEQFLNGSAVPQVPRDIPTLNIGYLPSSDNFAPLYVMARDSPYFCEQYGFCLVPDDQDATRPVQCTLFVQGEPAAYINLIPAQSGGGIMTTIGQNALEGAYVGSVPAELQIVLGNPASIIQSINTGGSGLVVGNSTPVGDWKNFINWVKLRSAKGKPVVIATVQSSIQENMIRDALAYENISVMLYGTDFETGYP